MKITTEMAVEWAKASGLRVNAQADIVLLTHPSGLIYCVSTESLLPLLQQAFQEGYEQAQTDEQAHRKPKNSYLVALEDAHVEAEANRVLGLK